MNDGLLTVGVGDAVYLSGNYSGAGTIAMAGNATLDMVSVSGGTIALAGGGNMISLTPPATGLTLDGLATGDMLMLYNTTPLTSARYAAGHLYLYSNGQQASDIATSSDLTADTLLIVPTVTGGALTVAAAGPLDTAALPALQPAERLIIGTSDVTNAGTLHIADVGAVEFQGTVAQAGTIAFDGTHGSLILDHPPGFHATLANMQPGDTITLAPGTGYALGYAGSALEVLQNGILAASFTLDSGYDLTNFSLDPSGLAPSIGLTAAPTQTFSYADNTSQVTAASHGEAYTGPAAGLAGQFIHITPDNVNVATAAPSVFIRTGAGDDAVQVTSGDNVIDASTGSNFLVGGTGHDTFFVDTTGGQTLWDSIVNFHAGDALTIWGYSPGVSSHGWADGLGAAGYTGLTLQIKPTGALVAAQATLVGLTSADLSSLMVQTGEVGGNSYLSIIHTSAASEPLLAPLARRIGKVPRQREHRVGHQRIDAVVEPLHRLVPPGHVLERRLKLGQVAHLDHDVPVAHAAQPEAQLGPRDPPAMHQPALAQMPHIGIQLLAEH
ncbi:MAG: hypothetical protein BGP12_06590 [Rhodospirillales bacterium 70-18]|nr:calcium-binding protein [Rhodospirillales bacterium]OJY74620.1 MAG: hypothetical protein BGP12_06590 [Rhodospirillales bacterium 70-18]